MAATVIRVAGAWRVARRAVRNRRSRDDPAAPGACDVDIVFGFVLPDAGVTRRSTLG